MRIDAHRFIGWQMNRVVAQVYAITIGHAPLDDKAKRDLLDLIPVLTAEINKLDEQLRDPFIQGWIKVKQELKP